MDKIDFLDGQTKLFSIACYDANSIQELRDAIKSEADLADLAQWGITASEWHEAIQAALADKLADEE